MISEGCNPLMEDLSEAGSLFENQTKNYLRFDNGLFSAMGVALEQGKCLVSILLGQRSRHSLV